MLNLHQNLSAMNRILFILFFSTIWLSVFSQIGVGTETPDNSAILDITATDKGLLFPRMLTNQREEISSPATGLHVFDITTSSLWFYDGATWVNYAGQGVIGDVKSGLQSADHGGWVKLNGRSLDSLTNSQKAAAENLGLSGTLPNAASAYLTQNGNALGSVTGSNTVTLAQANLPLVNFTGTAASAGSHNHGGNTSTDGEHSHSGSTNNTGSHSHSVIAKKSGTGTDGIIGNNNSDNANKNGTTDAAGSHSHTLDIDDAGDHSHTISSDGSHTHNVTVSSGGSGSAVNIAPKSMSVNMFIYLGY